MNRKKYLSLVWQAVLAVAILLLDQISKTYVLNNFTVGQVFGEIPFICDLIFVKNTGAAFSILSENTWILSIISVAFVVAVLIYRFSKKPKSPLLNLALVLFFAGALGNAIDRIAYGYVVDFISVKWFEFPVFNIADMAIVLGAVAAVIYVMFFDKDGAKDNG